MLSEGCDTGHQTTAFSDGRPCRVPVSSLKVGFKYRPSLGISIEEWIKKSGIYTHNGVLLSHKEE
jgi:hypothetical protein